MRTCVETYFLLFFVSAVMGWVMEVIAKLIQFRRFINRGFLIGPYCPIYGFGSVLVTVLLSGFAQYPAAVFVLAMAVCGTLEYLTSYLMEALFHARWWDYSQKRFNLNGRVCADTLIPFGLLGLAMVYVVKPALFSWFSLLSQPALDAVCLILALMMAADTVISTHVLGKIRKAAALSKGDSTEAITRNVREVLLRQSKLLRRTLRAFPHAQLYNARLLKELKAKRRELKAGLEAKKRRLREDLERQDLRLKKELAAFKERRHQ